MPLVMTSTVATGNSRLSDTSGHFGIGGSGPHPNVLREPWLILYNKEFCGLLGPSTRALAAGFKAAKSLK